ncbi:hypothetical protein ACIQWR_09180 [Streptomyces sp. NPDC098789]|uniref:hypothetical protein n=1 Tax=Streptomyces sp. NPDC098789 TaxID=3366098 RepID=UPI0037FE748C
MLDWVAALALVGGTTFTQAMAGQAWQSTRDALARILGRGDADREGRARERLDGTAAEVVRAAEAGASDGPDEAAVLARVAGQWETRLQDFLDEYPEARGEVEALIAQVRTELPQERAAHVTQTVSRNKIKGDAFIIGSAGRDISIGRRP